MGYWKAVDVILQDIERRAEEHRARYPSFLVDPFMQYVRSLDGPAILLRQNWTIARINKNRRFKDAMSRLADD